MKANVTEIASEVYRISTFHPEYGIQFNQFLVNDDQPFMMHTGFKKMFPITLAGVRSVIDPAKLRWIGFSHFESDECGALNEFLHVARHAQAVCSVIGAMVTVTYRTNASGTQGAKRRQPTSTPATNASR